MIRAGLHPSPRTGHWRRRAAVPLLLLLLLAGSIGSAAAQAPAQGEAAVMKRPAALRESPGDSGRSVAELAAQAPVTRLGERQGAWVRVQDPQGQAGWVHLFDLASPGSAGAGSAAGGALRSVTGFFNRERSPRVTTATSTIGIRGLGAEDLAQAQPDAAGVARMEALRQNESQARQFARDSALSPVQVEALPVPMRAGPAQSTRGDAP